MKRDTRLPLNFHQTFIPELRYLSILIEHLKNGFIGTDQELANITGIPMGKSSGKLPAILSYALGMGLIQIELTSKRRICLSELGRVIQKEDPYITEELTQWLLHFELCKKTDGADLWYYIYSKFPNVIGRTFNLEQLNSFLENQFNRRNKSVVGPAIRTYLDPAGLSSIDVVVDLKEEGSNRFQINSAPLFDSFAFVYAYFLLSIWEESSEINDDIQLTVTELNNVTEIFNQFNFNSRQIEQFLSIVEKTNAIRLDRQINPIIIIKKSNSTDFLLQLYDLL